MTQPPSQQPPQGGFGAPQDPPPQPGQPPQAPPVPPAAPPAPPAAQPGYGHPQPPAQPPAPPQGPPPAQPGYGYPAGDQPGGAQPGYGYPAGAQPGYGYPQAPGQPGPYGHQPTVPMGQAPGPYGQPNPYGGHPAPPQYPGAPTPPGGGGNPFKGKPGVIVAAAAAALLVVGGGVWFAVSGDDGKDPKPQAGSSQDAKPTGSAEVDKGDGNGEGRAGNDDLNAGRKAGESKVEWLMKNDVDLPRNGSSVYGPWVVGDTVVKGMYKTLNGYSTADGKQKWSVPLPTELCAAPVAPSASGSLVLGYHDKPGDKGKCTMLQQVDLKTGKPGWKAQVPKANGFFQLSEITLAISGGTVTAAGTNNSYGFSMTDGKQLWGKRPSGQCQPYAFAGGPKLIAAASCSTGGDYNKEQHEVSEVDPATGKVKWAYKMPPNVEVDKIYSVSPLIVSGIKRDSANNKQWSIIALTDGGKLRSQLAGGKDKFAPRCGGSFVVLGQNLQDCTGMAADANTFYLATDSGSVSTANAVVAFDLNTGKPKWRAAAPAERTMAPVRTDGGNVLVYLQPRYDKGGVLATLAPTGGAPKTLLQNPASTAEIENSFYSPRYVYDNGTFYVASGRVSASNDAEEKETKTMMAFGK
ncbi:PQQ-binding-like beta-propeller repeat protein [Streptomyces sp. NPDC001941]|uniref:outer membrane protein assembly factor BamB family protein n=1 Tax=Streptomyces sp. NPDC001941 TaxID=3154659 RepID=UPI0033321EFB